MKGMKNNMKKVLALALAAVMVMALCGVAFAAATDASDNFKVASVAISGIKDGNTLTLYKIGYPMYDSTTNDMSYAFVTGVTEAEIAAIEGTGYVFSASSTARVKADELANKIMNSEISPIATVSEVADSNTVTITNLPAGYYVGVVTGTNDTATIYQNLLINAMPVVDTTDNDYDPAADIAFTMKKTTDTITKAVGATPEHTADVDTDDAYAVGDTVPYEINTYIPNYPSPAKVATFKITDTPSDLTDDATSVTVTVGGNSFTKTDTATGDADTFTVEQNGDGFIITFAKAFIMAHRAEAVHVTYNAQIKSTAVIAANGETATNTANITFNPNPNETGVVEPEDITKLYTYGVYVYKFDEVTSTALEGADFTLTDDTHTYSGTTNANGYIDFRGLAAGTYTLTETKAPAGYRLPNNPSITIVIDKDNPQVDGSSATFTNNPITDSVDETNYLAVEVPNTPGATLPSTGGIGTTIFYVSGLIMVLGASIILVSRRRADAK